MVTGLCCGRFLPFCKSIHIFGYKHLAWRVKSLVTSIEPINNFYLVSVLQKALLNGKITFKNLIKVNINLSTHV